jgi:hypothetical protein
MDFAESWFIIFLARPFYISPQLFDGWLRPGFGRECAHGQRMDFRAHSISKCLVHQLMLLYPTFAGELRTHDHGLEVLAVIA